MIQHGYCQTNQHSTSQAFQVEQKIEPLIVEREEKIASKPYSLAVGSQMYAMMCTRLDIAHSVGTVS